MRERAPCLVAFFCPAPQIKRAVCAEAIREAGGRFVWSGELAALVWEGLVLSGPRTIDAALLKELGHYHGLLERLRCLGTVVPVRFCAAVGSVREARSLLVREKAALEEVVAAMERRAEWDVIAQWNLSQVTADLLEEDESLRSRAASVQDTVERIHLGAAVAAALAARAETIRPQIRHRLFALAEDHVEMGPLTDGVLFQAALLLEEEKEGELDQALRELDQCLAQRVNFRCVGPLPPHCFATADIYRPEFSQVDRARKQLGLGVTSTREEIQGAFRRQALEIHPDHCSDDPAASARFDELKQAYDLLVGYCRDGLCSFARHDVERAARVVFSRRRRAEVDARLAGDPPRRVRRSRANSVSRSARRSAPLACRAAGLEAMPDGLP